MAKKVIGKIAQDALQFSPVVIVVVGFFTAILWLKPNAAVVSVLTAAASIFVMGYTLFLGKMLSRRWDEVQRASVGFANTHGWVWGGYAALVLLMVPQVMNWLVDLVNELGSHDMTNQLAVRLAFFFGVILVMVMQTLAIVVASIVWQRRMGGIGERS